MRARWAVGLIVLAAAGACGPAPRPEVSVGPPAIICEGTPTDFTCEEQK